MNPIVTLSSSCHVRGQRLYIFAVEDGKLGKAAGAGITFDTYLRRRPINDTRAIFYSACGTVCLRNYEEVVRLPVKLPRMVTGTRVHLALDLDEGSVAFTVHLKGTYAAYAEVHLWQCWPDYQDVCGGGGFFSAVVSKSCSVSLH